MAQYPQGIFQSLDWLMKKVKILALQKQPVYNIGTLAAGTTYTMPGRGIYYGVSSNGSTSVLQFPNPALCTGQTIVVINTGNTNSFSISTTYAPKANPNSATQGVVGSNTQGIFICNGVNWYTVGL